MLNRVVHVLVVQAGKRLNGLHALRHFGTGHTVQGAAEVDVFAARQIGVETCAHFKQTGHLAAVLVPPRTWMREARQKLQQRGLARPIRSHEAQCRPRSDL